MRDDCKNKKSTGFLCSPTGSPHSSRRKKSYIRKVDSKFSSRNKFKNRYKEEHDHSFEL